MTTKSTPSIFISYSWSPFENKLWVLELAERLTRNGVNVIIDEWDTHEGQDKYHFMEKMVNDPNVNFVLLVCNKDYADKANSKKGGVGIESQIVSNGIYTNAEQSKFIPVVRELTEDGKPYLPTFVSNRFFIDLSDSEYFEDNYEQLLRRIFKKPKHKRPPKGEPPAYIKEEESVFFKTAHKLLPLKQSLIEDKKNKLGHINDYFDSFYDTLEDFKLPKEVNPSNPPIDEVVIEKLEMLRPLRDEFIDFLSIYVKYGHVDKELLFSFFETAYNRINYDLKDSSFDFNNHLQLFFNELFLYSVSVLLKYEKFEETSYLVNANYAIELENRPIEYEGIGWNFNKYNGIIDEHRKRRLNSNQISISSDLIKERATNKLVAFRNLVETDILLHYITAINSRNTRDVWFPRLSIYGRSFNGNVIIQKMQSQRFFEKVKVIFRVDSKDELFDKIKSLNKEMYSGYQRFYYRFTEIFTAFDRDKISSVE